MGDFVGPRHKVGYRCAEGVPRRGGRRGRRRHVGRGSAVVGRIGPPPSSFHHQIKLSPPVSSRSFPTAPRGPQAALQPCRWPSPRPFWTLSAPGDDETLTTRPLEVREHPPSTTAPFSSVAPGVASAPTSVIRSLAPEDRPGPFRTRGAGGRAGGRWKAGRSRGTVVWRSRLAASVRRGARRPKLESGHPATWQRPHTSRSAAGDKNLNEAGPRDRNSSERGHDVNCALQNGKHRLHGDSPRTAVRVNGHRKWHTLGHRNRHSPGWGPAEGA